MKIAALCSHYATALFNLSLSRDLLERHLAEMKSVVKVLKENPDLLKFLIAPSLSHEKKKSILGRLFQDQIDPLLLHFLFILVKKERFRFLPEIGAAYIKRAEKELSVVTVQLTTATAIDEKLKENLQHKLEQHYHKKIAIIERVNPEILGGMILIADGHMLDASLKTRLKGLKQNLLKSHSNSEQKK